MRGGVPHRGLGAALAASRRPLAGLWLQSGSPLVAEICADSGLDWLLLDTEHDPHAPASAVAQLQAVRGYPVSAVVRSPAGDLAALRRLLDAGVQDVVVPVGSLDEARTVVHAVRPGPAGRRSSAGRGGTLVLQVESLDAAAGASTIAGLDGVDGVLVDPACIAASMGLLGARSHADVVAAVRATLDDVRGAGVPVGVVAFDPATADSYVAAGASFVLAGEDVDLLAQAAGALARRFTAADDDCPPARRPAAEGAA